MNKPHAHIYSTEINKWIAGTLKLPTSLQPRSPHGALNSQVIIQTQTHVCLIALPGPLNRLVIIDEQYTTWSLKISSSLSSHDCKYATHQLSTYAPHSDNPVTASFHIWAHITYGWWRRCQDDPNGSPTRELEETTRASLYHVAEHHPVRSESLQRHAELSSRPGSELRSVEADVYVWRYALLVVHARKDEHTLRARSIRMRRWAIRESTSDSSLCICISCWCCQWRSNIDRAPLSANNALFPTSLFCAAVIAVCWWNTGTASASLRPTSSAVTRPSAAECTVSVGSKITYLQISMLETK